MGIDQRFFVDVSGQPQTPLDAAQQAAATQAGAIAGDAAGRVAGDAAGRAAGTEVASEAGAAAGATAGAAAGQAAGTGAGATAGASAGATAGTAAGTAAAGVVVAAKADTNAGNVSPQAAAWRTALNVPAVDRVPFLSLATAGATSLAATVKKLTTEWRAPNFAIPGTLVGGGQYARTSFADLTGVSARAYFRSVDRFMPDGTTDAVNGGYWLLDETDVYLEHLGVLGDGSDEASNINGALAACGTLGVAANLRNGATYYASAAVSVVTSIVGHGAAFRGKWNIGASNVTVQDVSLEVVGASPVGITTAGSSGARLAGIELRDVTVTFDASTAVGLREAVNGRYTDGLIISNCRLMYGINLVSCRDYQISGGYIDGEYLNETELLHATIRSYGTITGLQFLRAKDNWIDLYSSGERTVVTGCRFDGCTTHTGAGIEIKVTLTDVPGNSSGGDNGWVEQIIFDGNYFGGLVAQAQFTTYVSVYYIDTRAVPSFTWTETPRAVKFSNNEFDGLDATLLGANTFCVFYLNGITACSFTDNTAVSMDPLSGAAASSAMFWVERCKNLVITGNQGVVRYGCGMSLHGVNEGHTVHDNQFLEDPKGAFKGLDGIRAPKEGSRPDPLLTKCSFIGNKLDGTARAFRFPYYAAGGLVDCDISHNDCRQFSSIDRMTGCTVADNGFAGTAGGAVTLGSASAISAHNSVTGNRSRTPPGNTLAAMVVYRMRASGFHHNRAFDATEGLWFIGTTTDGELNDLTVKDNYSVAQTGASFPRYTTMSAGDTSSLVADNNRKVVA